MARKNVALPYKLEEDKSLSSSFQTKPYIVTYQDNVGICISCSEVTDNIGQFTVEASLDGEIWVDLEVAPLIALSNENKNFLISLAQLPFNSLRLSFNALGSSPDGSCTIKIMAKQVGG